MKNAKNAKKREMCFFILGFSDVSRGPTHTHSEKTIKKWHFKIVYFKPLFVIVFIRFYLVRFCIAPVLRETQRFVDL